MSTNYQDVGLFQQKFNLYHFDFQRPQPIRMLSHEEFEFRLKFLHEELKEFEVGFIQKDIVQIADALIDLVYVAMGTAHLSRLPWEGLWREVQRANMMKERAKYASDSKRNSTLDVVKPKGWTPPDIHHVLSTHQRWVIGNEDILKTAEGQKL